MLNYNDYVKGREVSMKWGIQEFPTTAVFDVWFHSVGDLSFFVTISYRSRWGIEDFYDLYL